ncbi:DUF192 domain-containing protein [Maribacter litopenaei]|uniref:DUF192 domain-containing protein n=1 Tax=Maribacter litopenaei TaxID=2976127 RepID=A0ABY5Y9H6_9FLAO|nr:DUF192 domain-containing protein [Maribacter litopenaei]UWX55703.1 DUF192 domain-containing protein [Maribacter litopenaei]
MKIYRYLFVITVIFFIGLSSCKEETKKVIRTTPVTFTKEGSLHIYKQETDSLISSLDIEIAETDYETQTGLMYRKGMETNQGMLFIFPDVAMHSFYMKNTEFPLDIVFIDENLKIASIQKNAKPFKEDGLSSKVPVKYVLELNAGLSDSWSLEIGDTVSFERI